MAKQRLVVLFGDSLLMDTVEASLAELEELGVMRVHTGVVDVIGRLNALRPDLIVFDLDTPHTQFLLPYLRQQPDAALLGLDITCSRVVALSSHHYSAPTFADLAQVIENHLSRSERESEPYDVVFDDSPNILSAWGEFVDR